MSSSWIGVKEGRTGGYVDLFIVQRTTGLLRLLRLRRGQPSELAPIVPTHPQCFGSRCIVVTSSLFIDRHVYIYKYIVLIIFYI